MIRQFRLSSGKDRARQRQAIGVGACGTVRQNSGSWPKMAVFRVKARAQRRNSDEMICWPVSARVGNVKNNDPSLTEPIAGIV